MLLFIAIAIIIITLMMDKRDDKKFYENREKILCKIDEHRMKEIAKLKQEIEKIKNVS